MMLSRRTRASLLLASCFVASAVGAQSDDEIWLEALRATGHARGVRASFIYQCREHLTSAPRHMAAICAKLPRIPEQVIEDALVPYAKRHLSMAQAMAAIAAWRSPENQVLMLKVIKDVESGGREKLSSEEIKALRATSDTDFGQALLALGKDLDALRAAVRAMGAYEP